MKQILKYALVSLSLAVIFSCGKENITEEPYLDVTPNNISGIWKLEQWNGAPMAEGTYVYMEITRKDRLFTLYQNTDSFKERILTGEYYIDENYIVHGVYDYSGDDWQYDYSVSELTADRMVWTAVQNPDDVSVYVRCESLPEELK